MEKDLTCHMREIFKDIWALICYGGFWCNMYFGEIVHCIANQFSTMVVNIICNQSANCTLPCQRVSVNIKPPEAILNDNIICSICNVCIYNCHSNILASDFPAMTPHMVRSLVRSSCDGAVVSGCRTRNHKVASSSAVTAVSSLGIGSLNHDWVPDMTG